MSVVNKMLRDLESREQKQSSSANYVPQKNVKHWILLGALVLVSLSVAATYAVSTAFIQDTSKDKIEPADIQTEKLPTDRYAKIEQHRTNLPLQADHNAEEKNAQPIQLTEQIKQPDQFAEYATGNGESAHSALKAIESSVSKGSLETNNTDTTENRIIKDSKETPVLNQRIDKTNDLLASNLAGVSASQNTLATVEQEIPKAAPTFEINKQTQSINKASGQHVQTLSVKPSDGSEQQLSNLRAQAYIESSTGNDNKVIQILNEILTLAPNDQKIRKQLAALLFSKARVDEASQVLHQGLILAPAESTLRLMLARAYFKSGNTEGAFDVLNQHPYKQMASDELLNLRAALAEKLGLYTQAQNDYQTLVNRNPAQAKWWLGLGVAQDKQKLGKQAISSYQQAKALNQLPVQVDSFVSKRIQLLARES